MNLDIVRGKIFCGKRTDTNFVSLTRLDIFDECPSGYVKCNPNATPDNTYCYQSLNDCPIN